MTIRISIKWWIFSVRTIIALCSNRNGTVRRPAPPRRMRVRYPAWPDVDSSLLLFCAAVKRGGTTVCLSGECADELFGGYPWYHREEILFEDTFPWSRSVGLRLGLLTPDAVRNGEEFVRQHYRDTCDRAPKLSSDDKKAARMREMFVLNLDWFMATLLDRKDRMSMYSGLEVRVPFCDHRIVEYAYNMPWDFKSLEGREKGSCAAHSPMNCPKRSFTARKVRIRKPFIRFIPACARTMSAVFSRITPRSPLPCSTGMPCKNSCSGRKALPNRGSDS